jgi:hypothetical protein
MLGDVAVEHGAAADVGEVDQPVSAVARTLSRVDFIPAMTW